MSRYRGGWVRLFAAMGFVAFDAEWALAREENLQGFAIPSAAPDVEPRIDFGPQAPPPAPFPVSPVDQSVLRGARHGFVNTTTGNLAFSALDMRLAGRMPIEIRRVYDSGHASAMPANPPNPPHEPRWSHNFGANWLLGCAGYLIATGNGVTMVTGEGDVLDWTEGAGGVFTRAVDAPTKHMKLTRQSATVIVERQQDGTKWTYTWLVNNSGSAYVLTEVADRSNNKLTLTYTQGFLSRIANTDGAYVDFFRPVFDSRYPAVSFPRNRIIRLNDSTGRVAYFNYNSSGELTTATDVRGKSWTYGYSSGRLSEAVSPLAETYLNASYDGAGRVQSFEADRGPWELAYLSGNVTRVTDAFDHPWDYTHVASGITTTVVEPTLGERVLTLDASNNPATYTGPMGESATWTYDANHRPLTHKPAGTTSTITYAYDANEGWVDTVTGLTGGVTTFIRDSAGRVTEERDAYNNKTTATYATNGDRLTLRRPKGNAVTPASGHQWSFTYDTFGSPATATDPTGRVFELSYTNRGEFTQIKRPDHLEAGQLVKATWTTKRDASGRSTGSIGPLGAESYHSYDDAGRLVNVSGPEGSNLRYEYDSRFRLTAIWNDAANIPPPGINEPVLLLQFFYDAAGNLEARGASIATQTQYGWDASGRLVTITDPLNRSWTYERDLSGRIKKVIWPSGRFVTITRDGAGRVSERLFPGGREEQFTYDASGQLLTANVDEGLSHAYLTWTRDLVERPLSLTTDVSWDATGESRTLTYTYDPNGNRATLLDGGTGETTTFDHDALDRIVGASKPQGPVWTVTYDEYSGHRAHVSVPAPGGGTTNTEDWTYDVAGRVLNHQWSRPGTSDAGNVTYTYGPENRVLSESDAVSGDSSSLSYRADGLVVERADSVDGVTTTNYFSYDGYGQLDSLGVVEGTSPLVETLVQYDASGRLRSTRRGLKSRVFTWDDSPEDQLSAFKVWRSPNEESERSLELEYGYDGRLRRAVAHHIEQQQPETTAAYLWSPLAQNLSLGTSELQEDGAFRSSLGIVDLGGLHTRVPTYGGGNYLDHPIRGDDGSAASLAMVDLGSAPDSVAPCVIGWSGGSDRFEVPVGIDAQETQLGATKGLVALAMQKESRPSVSLRWLGEELPTSRVDFIDDWTGEPIARRGVAGARVRALPGVVQLAADIAAGPSPTNPFSGPCNHTGCADKDAGDIPVDVCWDNSPRQIEIWTGQGNAPASQRPQNCIVKTWWRHGGQQSCRYVYQYARSTGLPESYRYPDITSTGVSLKNGDFIEEVTDLAVFDAAGDVPFTRTYRSGFAGSGPLGPKWRHNWEEALDFGRDPELGDACGYFVRWIQSDGSAVDVFWDPSVGGGWQKPPDANMDLRVLPSGDTKYEIRTSDGAVRRFTEDGELRELQRRSIKYTFDRDGNNRITTIKTAYVSGSGAISGGGERLKLFYFPGSNGKLERVESASAASTHFVKFLYNACGELETVTYPQTKLGYSKQGTELSNLWTPKTTYTYANMDSACASGNGAGYHMLATISKAQVNPLDDVPDLPVPQVRVLANLYGSSPLGAASMISNRVTTQCFGSESCTTASRRIDYDYAPDLVGLEPGEDWAGMPFDVVIHDRRMENQDVQERHHYYQDRLIWTSDDYAGADRRTTFHYNTDDLLDKITHPDGSCELRTYESHEPFRLVRTSTMLSSEACSGQPGAAPGRKTQYSYEWLTGQVLTETSPEAFENGEPDEETFKKFTRFYTYDVHQIDPNLPGAGYSDECALWGIPCPLRMGNVNFDGTDDGFWSGAPVRIRQWQIGPTGNLEVFDRYQVNSIVGRPISRIRPDFVREEFKYYSTSTQLNWSGSEPSVAGEGRLATSSVVSTTNQSLTTKFAYDEGGELTTTQLPSCERRKRKVAGNGLSVEEARIAPPGPFTTCPATMEDEAWPALNRTRYTYDLWGRTLRTAVTDDAIPSPVASSWFTYDTLGRLKSVTVNPDTGLTPGNHLENPSPESPSHLVSRTCYDGFNRPRRTISPERRVSCVNYDSLGRPVESITYAALAQAGQLRCLGETTEDGLPKFEDSPCPPPGDDDLVSIMSHDALDRPFSVTDPEGHVTYSWYDEHGNLRFVSDGKPVGARNPVMLGLSPEIPTGFNWFSESSFDLAGRSTRERFFGRNGRTETAAASGWLKVGWFEYDNLGRPRKAKTALHAADFVPVPIANQAVAPEDHPATRIATIETTYTLQGQVLQRKDAGGRAVTLDYDEFGRNYRMRLPMISGTQDEVERTYDVLGRPFRIARTSHHPDLPTPLVEVVDSQYDIWGRVIRTTGDPEAASGSEDHITTFGYDALSRVTERVQRWEKAQTYSGWGAHDRGAQTFYDDAGRVSSARQRSSAIPETWATTTYTYSRDGLMRSLQDAEGNTTTWDHTAAHAGLGRVQKMLYPEHDGHRQTIAITEYHKNGQPKRIRHQASESASAAAVIWENEFDDHGRLTERTASTEYVPTGTEFYGTNYQKFEYDDLGRIVRATDRSPWYSGPDIITENLFDTGGRLLMEDQQLPLNGALVSHRIESTFLPDGFRSELKYPQSYTVTGEPLDRYSLTMTPDTLGRLQLIHGPQNPWEPSPGLPRGSRELLRYSYLGSKIWSRTSGNGLEARFFAGDPGSTEALYDRLGRLRGLRYVDASAPGVPAPVDFRHGYDRVGNRTYEQRRHEPLANPAGTFRTRAFKSDLLGRLEMWREGGLVADSIVSPAIARDDSDPSNNPQTQNNGEAWDLDLVGNWSTHFTGASNQASDAFQPNALNQYTQVTPNGAATPKQFGFDWLGQLRQDDSKDQRYVWDLFGRLTRVVRVSDSAELATYRYDAFNRRIEKTTDQAPDVITRYFYDGWRSIEERAVLTEGSGSVERVRARYGFGLGLDEAVWMDRDVETGDIQVVEERYFLAQDALGSVVAATEDRQGTGPLVVAERYTYSAYGALAVWGGAWAGAYTIPRGKTSAIGMTLTYTGQRFDVETGLNYYKNRYFDSAAGRFLRRDLIGYADGPNLYEYSASLPNQLLDPLGLQSDEYRQLHDPHGLNSGQIDYERQIQLGNRLKGYRSAAYRGPEDYLDRIRRRLWEQGSTPLPGQAGEVSDGEIDDIQRLTGGRRRRVIIQTNISHTVRRDPNQMVEHGWVPVEGNPMVFEKDGVRVPLMEQTESVTNEYGFVIEVDFADAVSGVEAAALGIVEGADKASSWAGRNLRWGGSAAVRSRASRTLNEVSKSAIRRPWGRALFRSIQAHAYGVGTLMLYGSYRAEGSTPGEAATRTTVTVVFSEFGAFVGGGVGCTAGASTGPANLAVCPVSIFAGGAIGAHFGEGVGKDVVDKLNEWF